MKRKANAESTGTSQEKRHPGRPPMTAEERETAAKLRAAKKEKADNLRPELFLQYHGSVIAISDLVENAKNEFHSVKKRTLVTDMKLYIKPEEHMAYYVINDTYEGKIPL